MEQQQTINPRHELIRQHIEYLRRKSTMPEVELIAIAKRKPRKWSTTNGITQNIIDYITYVGGFANRINTVGRKIKTKADKEIWIKGTTKRGTYDIDALYSGITIKIEVKNETTKDRISPKQLQMKENIEQAGGVYLVATSFEKFYFDFHALISRINSNRA